MKKFLSLVLVAVLGFGLVGCGSQEKDVLNIGITDFPPMNYYENDKLVGFDTEFAEEVCKELGANPNFIKIDWGSKEVELKSKNIDAIWNGMTWTEERAENMLLSDKYMNNNIVLVVKKGVKFNPNTDSVSVEKGSTPEQAVDDDKYFANTKKVVNDSMTKGFVEVQSGNVTATACDYLSAVSLISDGSDYDNLEIYNDYSGPEGQFAIGFRKEDTDLCNKINAIMAKMKKDGRFQKIADKYGLGKIV